jgi:DNA (cytosine-5)-methyltransferase 1
MPSDRSEPPTESRPRLLDLYCGGGGAAMGYHRAGFDVIGVDIAPQYDYPFAFVLADASTFPLQGFDVVHASPPCKPFTPAANRARAAPRLFDPHPDHLGPTLARFATLDMPWVVENVPDAPMPAGSVTYCGSSFGLAVRRHRLFASNVPLTAPPCRHDPTPRYQSLDWSARRAGRLVPSVSVHGNLQGGTDTLELRRWAMGIDWLPNDRLTQAIPPAYTEHLGRQLLAAVNT